MKVSHTKFTLEKLLTFVPIYFDCITSIFFHFCFYNITEKMLSFVYIPGILLIIIMDKSDYWEGGKLE